tara:strand:- start:393 stop:857 length:465 start_codon:yes stop_codon:yes gene_type:complete
MMTNNNFSVRSIGYVKTKAIGKEVKDKSRLSQIIIFDDYVAALKGIEKFSHIIVLFWLNRITSEDLQLKVHPRGRKELPLLGVFATRSMLRPNPIGLTIVELIKVENKILVVKGLDAFDLTPILDIKPYDFWDSKQELKVPNWWKKLEKDRKSK